MSLEHEKVALLSSEGKMAKAIKEVKTENDAAQDPLYATTKNEPKTLKEKDPEGWAKWKLQRQRKKDGFRNRAAANGHKLGSFYREKGQICKLCQKPAADIVDSKCSLPRKKVKLVAAN